MESKTKREGRASPETEKTRFHECSLSMQQDEGFICLLSSQLMVTACSWGIRRGERL